jgi:hypothetical protein
MPEVDHPLLNTPLVKNLPRVLPAVHEELLEKVKAVVAKFHQDPTTVSQPQTPAADAPLPLPPTFSTEEETEKTGFLRRIYHLNATMRFVPGETLDSHWPQLLKAFSAWRKKREKKAAILTITFQSDPTQQPSLYQKFTGKTQSDPDLDAWIEGLEDYTLSFQELDGTNCRDLVREKQPDGSNLFTEVKYTPMQ